MSIPEFTRNGLADRIAACGLDWIVPAWAAPENVSAFFTTRNGGSLDPFDVGPAHIESLGADARAAILANRARAARFLPAPPCFLEQVHGVNVATLDRASVHDALPIADAAVTRSADVVLAVRVADCLPVLFADVGGSVVAAAHAGWRGLAAGVLESTLAAMQVPPASVVAWIGPGIGQNAFEVGEDVRTAFVDTDAGSTAHFVPRSEGKWLADLRGLAAQRLAHAGIARVASSGQCTASDPARFFSFRRDRSAARMAAFVWRSEIRAG